MKSTTKKTLTTSLALAFVVLVVVLTTPYETYASNRPNTPAGMRARRESNTSIRLWWSQVPRAHGYTVYRFNPQRNNFVRIATKNGRTRSFHIDQNRRTDRTYRYRVRAFRVVDGRTFRSEPTHTVTARAFTRNSRIVNARGINAPSSITLGIRQQRQVRATPIPARFSQVRNRRVINDRLFYRITNTNRATVSRTGQVTGRREGRTTLVIRTHNGYTRRVTVNVRNFAKPSSFNYTNVPEDIERIIRANKADFTAVASHFLHHPNSGRGGVFFEQNPDSSFRLVIDGSLRLGSIEPTVRRLLGNVPYHLTITIQGDSIGFEMNYTAPNGARVVNQLWFDRTVTWDDEEASENGQERLARHWFFSWGMHAAPPQPGP